MTSSEELDDVFEKFQIIQHTYYTIKNHKIPCSLFHR